MAGIFSFLGSGDNGAGLMRKTQQQQQGAANLATGKINSIFSAFGPEFYAKAMQAYENQAMPGVQAGATAATQGLGYSLARKGLMNSSSAQRLGEGLAKSINTDKQGVVNSAQGQVNQLKEQQGQQQAGLIAEATSANSPTQQLNTLGTASQFQAPGWFQGIGQTIGNWANTFLAQTNKAAYGGSFNQPSVQGPYASPDNWSSPGYPGQAVSTIK